jgi:hypothetical protein
METQNNYKLIPTFGNSFGTGWKVMTNNFLRLFLVVIIVAIILAPAQIFQVKFDAFDHSPWKWHGDMSEFFSLASLGVLAAFLGFIALLYTLMVVPVFEYGSKMIFLESVRENKPNFEWLIKGFMNNYFSIILANLLKVALVMIGLFAILVPGLIIASRLAFVGYIVMDKKVDPIEAVEMSWRLTKGYGWKIFFMGFVSFFILILGFCVVFVGVFPAIMWIKSSFASLYQSILLVKERPTEPVVEAA